MNTFTQSAPSVVSMSFQNFVQHWDEENRIAHSQIPLFNPELTKCFNISQKAYFAKLFYHARGHFQDFLWFMGSHAPDARQKKKFLDNIDEEFSGHCTSHDQ